MNNQEYKDKAKRTLPDLGSLELNLSHMVLGLGSELGELVSCVGTELKLKIDRANLKEELGDMYWYVSNYCNLRDIPSPEQIKTQISLDQCLDLLIISVGDLTNLVKRFVAYHAELNKAKELEIIYNIYTALALFESIYDITGEEIRKRNIDKLMVRFPEKYSDEKAINRDSNEERKVLE